MRCISHWMIWAACIGLPGIATAQDESTSLLDIRADYQTQLTHTITEDTEPDEPLAEVFELIEYDSPLGPMKAYLSHPAAPSTPESKHPAIVWLTGGFPPGGGGAYLWEPPDRTNDQSAQSYRRAGMVMMFPFLRGSSGNPGRQEAFYGEVNDVISAIKHLKELPNIDPERVYLGGHSSGGTLALLVAESFDGIAGVFAFGPTDTPAGYDFDGITFDTNNQREVELRAPIKYLSLIRTPTWIFEGTKANHDALAELAKANDNHLIKVIPVDNADHFDLLYSINALIAERIAPPDAPALELNKHDVQNAYNQARRAQRESNDLAILAGIRASGIDLQAEHTALYHFWSWDLESLHESVAQINALGLKASAIDEGVNQAGDTYYIFRCEKPLKLVDLEAVFRASRDFQAIADQSGVNLLDWDIVTP